MQRRVNDQRRTCLVKIATEVVLKDQMLKYKKKVGDLSMFDFDNANLNNEFTNTLQSIKVSFAGAMSLLGQKNKQANKLKINKFVNVLKSKVMSKQMDFWLPFKVAFGSKVPRERNVLKIEVN